MGPTKVSPICYLETVQKIRYENEKRKIFSTLKNCRI